MVAQVLHLEVLNGLDDAGGDEGQLLVDTRQRLEGVNERGGGRPEQRRGLARDDASVVQFNGDGGSAGGFGLVQRRLDHGPVGGGDAECVHDQLDLAHLALLAETLAGIHGGGVPTADDLLF